MIVIDKPNLPHLGQAFMPQPQDCDLTDEVVRRRDLSDGAKLLYVHLYEWAARGNEYRWTLQELSRHLGKPVSRVTADLQAIEACGLVSREIRRVEDGYTGAIYDFTFHWNATIFANPSSDPNVRQAQQEERRCLHKERVAAAVAAGKLVMMPSPGQRPLLARA